MKLLLLVDLIETDKCVLAAGDVRSGATKQAAEATGEGALAALTIRKYLTSLGE